MPGLITRDEIQRRKRKPQPATEDLIKHKKSKSSYALSTRPAPHSAIKGLEASLLASDQNLNDLSKLLTLAEDEKHARDHPALVALCRVFARLISERRFQAGSSVSKNERILAQWLIARFKEYKTCLRSLLEGQDPAAKSTALALWMQTVKSEVEAVRSTGDAESQWEVGSFRDLLAILFGGNAGEDLLKLFTAEYLNRYEDVRHHFFRSVSTMSLPTDQERVLSLLLDVKFPESHTKYLCTFLCLPTDSPQARITFSAHKKAAQRAWLALLSGSLSSAQRKSVLELMTHVIVPWFQNTALLMDFLTDSFNLGGSTSLLALSGLFHLIQEHNLDYPGFYTRLYSMLDADLLHSRHRSRFLRLMNTFLSSTHLPANLVASFIKRLSRLALHGPPAAVVAVIPWIYNAFKAHPTTTFLMHRAPCDEESRAFTAQYGALDTFDMNEKDPMETGAIDSCVWELVSLQFHYHPNVASLAKIISQQFTKERYNLDDFLDYSYSSLIESELGKEIKKTPATEWVIPRGVWGISDEDQALVTTMGLVYEDATQ